MRVSRKLLPLLALVAIVVASAATPVRAGDYVYFGGYCYQYDDAPACFRDAQRGIYHRHNLIAHLEANPDIDDAYKAAVIPQARAEIHALRRWTGVRHHLWPVPCCYARRPIYIR